MLRTAPGYVVKFINSTHPKAAESASMASTVGNLIGISLSHEVHEHKKQPYHQLHRPTIASNYVQSAALFVALVSLLPPPARLLQFNANMTHLMISFYQDLKGRYQLPQPPDPDRVQTINQFLAILYRKPPHVDLDRTAAHYTGLERQARLSTSPGQGATLSVQQVSDGGLLL